jgi:hypothetical protein
VSLRNEPFGRRTCPENCRRRVNSREVGRDEMKHRAEGMGHGAIVDFRLQIADCGIKYDQ